MKLMDFTHITMSMKEEEEKLKEKNNLEWALEAAKVPLDV